MGLGESHISGRREIFTISLWAPWGSAKAFSTAEPLASAYPDPLAMLIALPRLRGEGAPYPLARSTVSTLGQARKAAAM
jgi:hypothetical protein